MKKRPSTDAGLVWLILRMALTEEKRVSEIASAFDLPASIVSDICRGICPAQPKRKLHQRQSARARTRRLGLGMA